MSLSSLIVQREIATIRQVEEALSRQVLYGGDLITNLLEVAQLDEKVLLTAAADLVGLVPAPFGVLPPPDAKARSLVPVEMVTERSVYPLHMSDDGEQVVVIIAEPLSAEEEEQLMFALGVPVVQRLGAHVRIREAVAREYGTVIERRLGRLLARMRGDKTVPAGSLPPLAARSPSGPPPSMKSRTSTSAGFPAGSIEPDAVIAVGTPIDVGTPTDVQNLPPVVPNDAPTAKYNALPDGGATLRQSGSPAPAPVRPARRRRGPLPFEAARLEMEAIADRDGLLDLFFDFARQYFEYAALFIVHGDIAEGRESFGAGATRERVVGIGVPLDMPGMLASARDAKEPVLLVPNRVGLDAVLLADLERTRVRLEVIIVPVVVRGRAVALLFGDSGENAVERSLVADVITFAKLAGQSFERLILKKKLGGFTGAGAAAPVVGRVDAQLVLAKRKSQRPQPVSRSDRAEALGRALLTDPKPVSNPSVEAARGPLSSPRAVSVNPPAQIISDPLDSPTHSLSEMAAQSHPISGAPPPLVVVQVRRPSGRPIPREDPSDATSRPPDRIPMNAAVPTIPALTENMAPREAEPRETAVRDRRREAEDAESTTSSDELSEDEAKALLQQFSEPGEAPDEEEEPEDKYPPSQSFVAAPRRPPSSRIRSPQELPSVMVDVARELEVLVERFITDPTDEAAEAELLRQGKSAMPAIMAHFPGPVVFDPRSSNEDDIPPVGSCGPILRLIAGQRRVALQSVLSRIDDPDETVRFWATALLAELSYAEAVPYVVARLSDKSTPIRRVARIAARALAKQHGEEIAREIGTLVRATGLVRSKRLELLGVLEEMREPLAVPSFISVLEDENDEVSAAARGALMIVTRQDFGRDARRWMTWWNQNSSRHRVEWLMDALTHEHQAIRHAAGEELKVLTKEYFGYYDDLPKKERDKAQLRYREWWTTEGRMRFKA
jgi:hypothetical protein